MINSWPLMIYTADDQRRINYCTNRAAASPAPVPNGAADGKLLAPKTRIALATAGPGHELFAPTALNPSTPPPSHHSEDSGLHPPGTVSIPVNIGEFPVHQHPAQSSPPH